ncbi:polysaccharide export outer membrane protein [Gelidibacter sediminis]|uniref:Polysaccharide export outer membrane protein n=1 Tax=Gelidibacter sediminis TaxID=1608710 RepID=A0A4R7Q5P4_9FLAO|nr:polysaccharide biosynthesis/export family protein [Gelidibacter sediminis]TDU42877.1 polysaccharide export outer membrane protein [Gelidibacter sediminis]
MKFRILAVVFSILVASCASKKDILYLQDADVNNSLSIGYQDTKIQPNDILKITVESLVPEAAVPYNRGGASANGNVNSVEIMKLEGYLVNNQGFINFPILGDISVVNLTIAEVQEKIKQQLISEGHLNNPTVIARLLNAKITILGEVNAPGTYTFTEQNITILQALGYAGDLTINGKRNDIIITRDVDGIRKISHIDLTSTDFMNSEYYYVKPNDNIIVNQNDPKVKSAGFVGDLGAVLTLVSLGLSITILLTR